MSANSVNGVLRYIRTLVAGHKAEGQPDQLLVEQFVCQRDETAFAALLERHGPMVLGVCRRFLHDEHLTEDAFQATFLVLARKAAELRKRESVASYLHRVAMNMARKVRLDASKSRQPTLKIAPPPSDTETQVSWREQQGILDQELQRLPEKYRVPLLLCYLEGRTRDEAALQLGWTTGKLRSLLDRAREQLRAQLVRRGVTLSVAGSATLLTDAALSASVPPLLALSTVKASLSFAGGASVAACGVSTSVAALVEASLLVGRKKMLLMATMMLLITGVAGLWASGWFGPGQEEHSPDQQNQSIVAALPKQDNSPPPTEAKDSSPKAAPVEPLADGAMTFAFTNNTRGKFADEQIFWAIVGNGSNHLGLNGKLVPMKPADNSAPGHLTKKGVKYANFFHSLAEAKSIVVPRMTSARLYVAMGSPMYFRVLGSGYGGADVSNPADPNHDVFFDFIEFTLNDSGFHGNTTQVDAFGIPLVLELVNDAGMSKTCGISESRRGLFDAFKKEVPPEFASCLKEPFRIVAPCKGGSDFGKGSAHANYLDGYIDQVWRTYAKPTTTAGGYTGQVVDGALVFTHPAGKTQRLARKPTTQEVFLGSGPLGGSASREFCAAINRHVLADPADWSDQGKYYQTGPANYYARFWHDHSIDGKAYGFCYDDDNAQAPQLEARRPTRLNVTISWD